MSEVTLTAETGRELGSAASRRLRSDEMIPAVVYGMGKDSVSITISRSDLRKALGPQDIVVSDVGAHKVWMARLYPAEAPNTCIISNGFAAMGIALPGAIAAKRVHPDRKAVAVVGDAGFMMNCQEIETALRIGTPLVVLIWRDDKYGLIKWHQDRKFGHDTDIAFGNPDFVKFAESFGAKGYRIEKAADLLPTLERALAEETVVVIDCPVDYSENMKLTRKLGEMEVMG